MSYTLSGGVVTQTGTDATLAGLSAIAGVTTILGATKILYRLGSLRIDMKGVQTHNPDEEELLFFNVPIGAAPITISTNGIYNYGKEYVKNGVTAYTTGTGIRDEKQLGSINGFNATYRLSAPIYINGGRLNWKGGHIISPCVVAVESGALDIFSGSMYVDYNTTSSNPPLFWIEAAATLVNIRNLTITSDPAKAGLNFSFSRPPDIFTGVVHYHGWGIGTGGVTLTTNGVATEIRIENYSTQGEDQTASFWRDNYAHLVNFSRGSDIIAKGMLPASQVNNIGIIECSKQARIKVVDAAGVAISGSVVYCKDYNNNLRQADRRGLSWTADRIYSGVTDAAGITPAFEILLCALTKTGSDPVAGVVKDFRSKNGDITDIFEFYVADYGKALSVSTNALKGLNETQYEWTLFTDALISQSDSTVTAAYTTIDTAAKLYDFAKLELVNGYAGESETTVTRVGSLIDARALDVVIDSAATSVFDLTGNTLTIKATTFVGSLQTTGTVTLVGATVSGSIQDSTGTQVTITAGEGNLSSYVILADASGNYAVPDPRGTVDDLGWVADASARTITIPPNKTAYIYSIVYGFQPKITFLSSAVNTTIAHIPENSVNTTLDTVVRDDIVSKLSHTFDGTGNLRILVAETLVSFSPDEALNALHYFIYMDANFFAALSTVGKSAGGVRLKADGVQIYTNKFYGSPADSITPATTPNTGIVLPLNFENLTGDPTYQILRKNINDVPLTGALWVRSEANIGEATQVALVTKTAIAVKTDLVVETKRVVKTLI